MHTDLHRKCPVCSTPLKQEGDRWEMVSRRSQVLTCTAQLPTARAGHRDWIKGRLRNKLLLQMEDLRLGLSSQNSILRGWLTALKQTESPWYSPESGSSLPPTVGQHLT